MGNRNRPIVPSTVPAGPIARRGGRHNTIWLRVYDPIFVVFSRTCPFYMKDAGGVDQKEVMLFSQEGSFNKISNSRDVINVKQRNINFHMNIRNHGNQGRAFLGGMNRGCMGRFSK